MSTFFHRCVYTKLLQMCLTLCDPVAHSPPGSSVHEILLVWRTHWSGLPCPAPGDLLDPGMEPMPLKSPALAGVFFTPRVTQETFFHV